MLAQIQAMFAVVDLGKINWNQFLEKYLEIAMSIIGKVIVSFLIIAIGFKLIKILIKLLKTTLDRKSTRLNSSHIEESRMPSSA